MTEFGAEVFKAGDWHATSLSAGNLSELLEQGVARLEAEQVDPPLELLGLLENRLGNFDAFGPCAVSPKVLNRITESVFRSNLRQAIVEGYPLSWIAGRDQLKAEAEKLLSGCKIHSANLFEQFRMVGLKRALNASGVVHARRILSVKEQRSNGLVPKPIGLAWMVGDARKYVHVGQEWRRFHEQLEAIEDGCLTTINKAMKQGRVLCSEDTEKGDRLIHPEQVAPFNEHPRKGAMHYLFTRDLPSSLFHDMDDLPRRRTLANAWIKRAGNEFAAKGKRATKEQLLLVAMEKFDLTEHAVERLWPKVEFPGKRKSGRPRNDEEVSLSEIREIE